MGKQCSADLPIMGYPSCSRRSSLWIISIGYNGMPSGWDNCCEDDNKTKAEVLHAETNAVAKLAKSSESGLDATMFVTHEPCIDCAKLVYQSGIATVYYKNNYRSTQGLDFLIKSDVNVIKV